MPLTTSQHAVKKINSCPVSHSIRAFTKRTCFLQNQLISLDVFTIPSGKIYGHQIFLLYQYIVFVLYIDIYQWNLSKQKVELKRQTKLPKYIAIPSPSLFFLMPSSKVGKSILKSWWLTWVGVPEKNVPSASMAHGENNKFFVG